jgi:hypothetical protein
MRFTIVDLEGASRDYFSRREDVLDALAEFESEHPGAAEELFVVTYDDDGNRSGEPERGDEVLTRYSSSRTVFYFTVERRGDVSATRDAELVGTSHAAGSA